MLKHVFATFSVCSILSISVNALSPEEALKSFELHPDFSIELVASEPVVKDPVDMCFDAQGRAYVLEFAGYPFPDAPGNIILLEDTDKDGQFDKRNIFATGFEVAPSIMAYNGGLLVADPPEIVFLKDSDGDNVADIREVVLGGFPANNQQHNANGLTYGLDNWIYGANGGNSGSPYWPETPDKTMPIAWDDFRFDIDTKRFERTTRSSGGFEITHDPYGRWFSTHNMYHVQHTVFPDRYLQHIPSPRGGTLERISNHEEGGLGRIFPIGAQETRVNHPEQSGYFSAACGITYYDGGAFGEAYNDNLFVSDVVVNVIHRDIIRENGTTLSAARGRERVEFLASPDRAFRPVNMTIGPDGAMYVLDMNRDVIEHPEWIPDELEEKMDLDAGKDKGRIYRITPKAGLPRVTVNYAAANSQVLIAALGHRNAWHRKTAQRLLVERKDLKVVQGLEIQVKNSKNPLARLHALWTLTGLDALSDKMVLTGLRDSNAGVRENTLMMIEERGAQSDAVQEGITKLAHDPHPRVRMMCALVMGSNPTENRLTALQTIIEQDLNDPWSRLALTSAIGSDAPDVITILVNDSDATIQTQAAPLIGSLAQIVGRDGNLESISTVIGLIADKGETSASELTQSHILDGLVSGMAMAKFDTKIFTDDDSLMNMLSTLQKSESLSIRHKVWQVMGRLNISIERKFAKQLRKSRDIVLDKKQPSSARQAHLNLLEFDSEENRLPILFALLNPKEPAQLQASAITQLSRIRNSEIPGKLITIWDTLGPKTRARASDLLIYQSQNHEVLLTALENGDLILGEMRFDLERRRRLLWSKNESVVERAKKLFSDAGVVTRKEAMARMQPATTMKGDPAKGALIFTNKCADCHTIGTEGSDLAPNLTDIFRKSSETLLHDIVDPNAAIDTEYIAYNVEVKSGEFFSGIVVRDDDSGVTLRNSAEERSYARDDIVEMFSSGISIMPEELEVDMDVQAMADLIAFLQQPR